MSYRYESTVITSGGTLHIQTNENNEGDIVATFKDEFGEWSKTFFDKESFKKALKSLHTKNLLRMSESGSCK